MSTAIMPSSTIYDFGDTLFKNHNNNVRTAKGVRWNSGDSSPQQRAVGSPVDFHRELCRRTSTPAGPSPQQVVTTVVLQVDQHQHRKLDRSHSEPAATCKSPSAAAGATNTANVNTSRYKTELCRPFEESGICKYGDKCQFAHGAHELRTLVRHPKYKTELCRTYHTIGLCPYGPRCHFVHNDEEALTATKGVTSNRPKPLTLPLAPAAPPPTLTAAAISLSGSVGDSPSPTSSLSQSPTNSQRSFFMDPFSPESPPTSAVGNTAFSFGHFSRFGGSGCAGLLAPSLSLPLGLAPPSPPDTPPASSPAARLSPSPPLSPVRLPIFNSLSSHVLKLKLEHPCDMMA